MITIQRQHLCGYSINRTLVELKFIGSTELTPAAFAINRTLVELKYK